MLNFLFVPIVILYFGVVGSLFIYGINFFYLTYLAWRKRGVRVDPPPLTTWPRVTVQLPIYNELYVAERLIEAAGRLDYPPHRLEIQVLDDSTDETVALVRGAVERLRARGLDIVHLHRAHREGFKAGALAAGLARARGEFLAIFDADFIPPSDFLRRTLSHFQSPRVAFVQTRWGYVNRDYSLLTYLQSLAIDAHFVVEQFARAHGGHWFNFNGTAGVWRRAALEDAGGWTADTLTEDLDVSYRAFLRGWRAVYLREVVAPGELPVSFSAYRRQQHRWARGSMEVALKLLPPVWNASIPFTKKFEATLHLTGYGVHLLLCALAVLYPAVVFISLDHPAWVGPFGLLAVFTLTTFAPLTFFAAAQQQLGRRWWEALPLMVLLMALGCGMMLNTVRAALHILRGRQGVFERTPKFGVAHRRQAWVRRRYQLRLDPVVFYELAFALFNFGTAAFALRVGNAVIAGHALLFGCGLLFTSGLTLAQALAVYRNRPRFPASPLAARFPAD